MNPRDGAIRLCQLIRNDGVATELRLRSEVIKCDIEFTWIVTHIERGLGFPKSFDVEPIEGADAVAVLLANDHVTYEVRRLFASAAGTDPAAAIMRLQRAAAQAPQSTRTINKSADKLMRDIEARNPGSMALDFASPPTQAPPQDSLGFASTAAATPPPGTTVVGTASGLIHPPPRPQEIPDVGGPSPQIAAAPAPENGTSEPAPVRNARGQFVRSDSIQDALAAGDLDALRALLG